MQQYQEGVVEAPFGDLSTYVSTAPQLGAPARFPALKFYSSLLAGHYFAVNRDRRSLVALIVVLVVLSAFYVFNLWTQLSNFS